MSNATMSSEFQSDDDLSDGDVIIEKEKVVNERMTVYEVAAWLKTKDIPESFCSIMISKL